MKLKAQQFKVYIDAIAREKLFHWVALAKGEVSGLGRVREFRDDNGNLTGFMVDDIFLVKQKSTAATTELDDEAVAALLVDLDNGGMDVGDVRCWWHSHGSMDTFWSTTDDDCAAGLANSKYFISIVTNKKGALLCRVDIYEPVRVTIDEVPIETALPDYGTFESCKAEFAEKVTETADYTYQGLMPADMIYDDLDYPEGLSETKLAELVALEEEAEQGILTYHEYCERYMDITGEREIVLGPCEDSAIN
jgi:hypothetical protein